MRRLICLLAALVAVAGPLAAVGAAVAEDRRGGGHEQGGGGRGGMGGMFGGGGRREAPSFRGGEGGGREYRPQEYRQPQYRPQQDYRPQEYRQPPEYRQQPEYRPEAYRGEAAPAYGYRGGAQPYGGQPYGGQPYGGRGYAAPRDPRADPRVYAPPPSAYSANPRRGGYMGQSAPVVGDYAAKRLRPPPPGYDWMQTQRGYALVSRSTHQVFDVVPY